jgi:outer membrane protein assembly factor BamE (lipoprotein component of BamABCDE complex)
MSSRILFTSALLLSGLAACAPIRDVRGYIPDTETLSEVKIGADTRDSVQQKLGTPSSTATFGDPTWYYISTEQERYAFFTPDVTKRQILAVEFGEDGTVADMRRYGIEDGIVVALVDRETPSRGKEMGFLQQLLGNMGGIPAGAPGQATGPGRPGDNR